MVAGEASGDLHAAAVIAAIRRAAPDVAIIGVGGARMKAAGAALLEDIAAHAVMGFAGVVGPRWRSEAKAMRRGVGRGRAGSRQIA